MTRAAAFLDRDGTIIRDVGFLADPAGVELIPGAAEAMARLTAAGLAVVVITNQSGIARGLITWDQYHAVARELDRQLAARHAAVEASYACPHYPPISGPCECRKPSLGSYRLAAARFDLDLARSLYVGDRPSDVEPARATGGRGMLVRTGEGGSHAEATAAAGIEVVRDLAEAVDRFLGQGAP